MSGRAKPERTKYPGVFKRRTTHGVKYDIAVRMPGEKNPKWIRGQHTDLEAANKHRLALLYEVKNNGGNPFASKPKTFAAFADQDWTPHIAASVARGDLQSSTAYNYRRDLEGHLRPAFGAKLLANISVEDVERFQDALSARGLKNWTVRRIVTTLSGALELARRRRLIQMNPVKDVRKVEARSDRQPIPMTRDQVFKLAGAAPCVDERNLIILAAFTGARISELFGLRWTSVDLTEGKESIIIAEQCYQGQRTDRAKTPSGFRKIILGPEAAEALRSQQVEGRHSDLGIVFPSPDGTYWRASNFNRRPWKTAREKAELVELHFHDLRHFYVTYIRTSLGLAPALTEQLAGHSDERTHRHYTQATDEGEQQIRTAMARAHEEAATG